MAKVCLFKQLTWKPHPWSPTYSSLAAQSAREAEKAGLSLVTCWLQ